MSFIIILSLGKRIPVVDKSSDFRPWVELSAYYLLHLFLLMLMPHFGWCPQMPSEKNTGLVRLSQTCSYRPMTKCSPLAKRF